MNEETSWNLVHAAAKGDPRARESFAKTYLPAVRSYLSARWRNLPLGSDVDDAVQEVFLDCYRDGGALARLDRERCGGFRAYLFGVTRTVALHFETRRGRELERRGAELVEPHLLPADDTSISRVFDREWARTIMREAADLMTLQARQKDSDALRRVELLHLRFNKGLPIREIAQDWKVDASHVHHEYAKARREFLDALREVVKSHEGCPPERLEEECVHLLGLLG